ncbi:MAG: MlaD family protein [Halomonas sp.]
METRAHHILIGLFTLLTLLAAVAFSLWMAQAATQREYAFYEVVFNRAVSGLSTGSRVEFSGLEVGNVVEMRLDPDDPRKVLALIRVDQEIPIREDTQARLGLANITGSMTLQLYGGSPDSARLDTSVQEPAQIIAAPSPIDSLLSDGEAVVSNVSRLLNNLNMLFEEDSAERLNRIIANTDAITAGLAEAQPQLTDALNDSISRLNDLTLQATTTLDTIDSLGQSTTRLIEEDSRATMQSAQQAAEAVTTSAEQWQLLMDRNASGVATTVDNMAGASTELPAIVQELQATLININRISRRLEENPGDFIFGGEQIKEFRP